MGQFFCLDVGLLGVLDFLERPRNYLREKGDLSLSVLFPEMFMLRDLKFILLLVPVTLPREFGKVGETKGPV